MKKVIYSIVFVFLVASCNPCAKNECTNSVNKKSNTFYHYSIWWAFVNRVFDGTLTSKELQSKGDIALGSYNALGGELVMNEGNLYKVTADGVVHKATDNDLICYANATWFKADTSYELNQPVTYDSLRANINRNLPTHNQFYAFKIHGTFDHIKCGGVPKQEKPYNKGLDELLPTRPVFEKDNVTGTMVGFFCPQFIGNINVAGFHLHFISDDASFGGHVMDFKAQQLAISMGFITKYTFELPKTDEFMQGKFEKEFQYGKK